MVINGSDLNSSAPDPSDTAVYRPPWVTTTLGCFLIFTIVVDILGNLLVIFSVYRNKKLRNAGEGDKVFWFFIFYFIYYLVLVGRRAVKMRVCARA